MMSGFEIAMACIMFFSVGLVLAGWSMGQEAIKNNAVQQERARLQAEENRVWKAEQRAARLGYVYLIKDISVTGHYKIGRTKSKSRRFADFAAKWPFEWKVIHVIETYNDTALEARLHRQFASKRQRGEWFDLTDDDVKTIQRMH